MLATILKLLQHVPAVVAATTEFRLMISDITGTLAEDDQEKLKTAYQDHIEASNEAHERFQALLTEAEGR